VRALAGAAALAVVIGGGALARSRSRADDAGVATPLAPTVLEQAVAAGRTFTWTSAHGPIKVWVPAGYHADGAAIVLYVHGYYTDLDQAWVEHQLPEQFALASVNAVFIAPEAPSGARQAVAWLALEDLLAEVFAHVDVARPMGEVIAVGHSGAYRTLLPWLEYPLLDTVVAVDSTYAEVDTWLAWMAASSRHRLIVVGDDTVRWTEELIATLEQRLPGQVVTLDRIGTIEDVPAEARTARAVYFRSQYSHLPLVTSGLVLPVLLRLVPVEVLADGPWREPLGLPARLDAGVVP